MLTMPKLFKQLGEFFLDIIETLVIALSIFLVVYLFFMQPHQVNGQSMVPTFQNGEYLLTDKISYRLGEPERGDVIVFHAPENANCPKGTGCDFIKRIVAMPGENVTLKDGDIYINEEKINESYISEEIDTLPGQYLKRVGSVSLGAEEFFAVGDNRPYSSDSREWGPISKSDIVGKAFFRYWPVSAIGFLSETSY